MNIEKLGKLTKDIGHIFTYGYVVMILLIIIIGKNSFSENLEGLFIAILTGIIGYNIYSLYDSYKEYLNDEISLKKFKIKWSICLIACISIVFLTFIGLKNSKNYAL